MTPTISVVIPCYNGAAFLNAAIASVVEQTWPPFEVIVVDDGSTDRSAAIAASHGPPVRLIRQLNKGESGARNAGAAVAAGSHLFFLDADDLIRGDALQTLAAAAAAQPAAVVLMGAASFIDDPERPFAVTCPAVKSFFPGLIHDCLGVPHSWLTPRAIYCRTNGFAPTRNYFVDWEFWCQVALLDPPLVTLPYVGALYRRHAGSMSAATPTAGRIRGHLAVMATLSNGLIANRRWRESYGGSLFWCCWTAVARAREHGVPWMEIEPVEKALVALAHDGPEVVRKAQFARAIRCLGFRAAYRLRTTLSNLRATRPLSGRASEQGVGSC